MVTLATGRRFSFAKAAADTLGIRAPLVLHGGAVIQDSETGDVVYEDTLDTSAYTRIVSCIFERSLQPVVFESPAMADGSLLAQRSEIRRS